MKQENVENIIAAIKRETYAETVRHFQGTPKDAQKLVKAIFEFMPESMSAAEIVNETLRMYDAMTTWDDSGVLWNVYELLRDIASDTEYLLRTPLEEADIETVDPFLLTLSDVCNERIEAPEWDGINWELDYYRRIRQAQFRVKWFMENGGVNR